METGGGFGEKGCRVNEGSENSELRDKTLCSVASGWDTRNITNESDLISHQGCINSMAH